MSINYNCRFKKYSENKRDYISKKDNEDYYKTDSVSTNLIKCAMQATMIEISELPVFILEINVERRKNRHDREC